MNISSELKNVLRHAACALTIALLLPSSPAALAQPYPAAPNRRPPPPGANQGGDQAQPGFQPGGALPLLERILTREQRESLRAAMESQHDQRRDLQDKLRTARQALMRASLAEEFDEAAVRAKALEVGRLDAELTVLRAKALSTVQPPLSEEQIESLSNPPPPERERPPGGPGAGPRRNHRPPPSPRDLPVAPEPEAQ